jgi:hypothetical protein
MSTETATKPRGLKLPRRVGGFPLGNVVAGVAIAIAIVLPLFYESGSPFIEDSTTAQI